MPALIVIPARLAATRLPNKPLAMIGPEPMIVHVWERAVAAGIGPAPSHAGEGGIDPVGRHRLSADSAGYAAHVEVFSKVPSRLDHFTGADPLQDGGAGPAPPGFI